jgi:hypothetical protein
MLSQQANDPQPEGVRRRFNKIEHIRGIIHYIFPLVTGQFD